MDVVTVVNYKGGVGKTTVTVNLGAEFARQGKSVLLLDLDPQSSLTLSLFEPEEWRDRIRPGKTFGHWLRSRRPRGGAQSLEGFVTTPERTELYLRDAGRLDLVASDLTLSQLEEELLFDLAGANPSRSQYLRVFGRVLEALETVRPNRYDLVLIDCPPNFGVLTRAAVIASNGILVPARADMFSVFAIDHLQERLNSLQTEYNDRAGSQAVRRGMPASLAPRVLGVVFTMVRRQRDNAVSQSLRTFINQVGELYPIFGTVVSDYPVQYTKSAETTVPIVLWDSVPGDIAQQWRALSAEFTSRLEAPDHA